MPPPVVRRAPYKDFLQPALQRRFAATAGILFGIAYIQALTWSTWNSLLWSWFPLGLPGLRALSIFGCVLPVVILRIAHSHIGIRTSNSSFETICDKITPFSTLETILTFAFSAWAFSQVYLLSAPEEANLGWITRHSGDRARLNERALFYTVNLVVMGIVQGVLHVALDFDAMTLGLVKPKREGTAMSTRTETWAKRLGEYTPILVMRSGMLSIAVALANYIFLYSLLRRSAWAWTMSVFRWFYNLPKSNIPPASAPWSIWMLGRSVLAGFLLCLLWYFGDMTFRLQLGREPLKNNQPLTAESKDPNGSLLNGLKSKKDRISAFAMWELAFIARDFDTRRQTIYEDIDRKDGPVWSQTYAICMDMVKKVEQRIDNYGKAPVAAPSIAPAEPQPRERVVQPLKTANILAAPPSKGLRGRVGGMVNNVMTSPGTAPLDTLIPKAKKTTLDMTERLMTQQQRDALTPGAINGAFHQVSLRVLRLPIIGPIFRRGFGRQVCTAILGRPYGEVSVYVNAIYALSQLAVCSLAEDRYGNVQRDVPAIMRTFTVLIKKLEAFVANFPMHWTDLDKNRECHEVDVLLEALKDGLGVLVEAFGQYSSDLRLTRADMRLAKEAAQKKDKTEKQATPEEGWEALMARSRERQSQEQRSDMQQVS